MATTVYTKSGAVYPYEFYEFKNDNTMGLEGFPSWYWDECGTEHPDETGKYNLDAWTNIGEKFSWSWAFHDNGHIDVDPEDLPSNFGLEQPTT